MTERRPTIQSGRGDTLRLRLTPEGAELRCPDCLDWLPLTPEFWINRRWYSCRACDSERKAMQQVIKRRTNKEWAEGEVHRARRYRAFLKKTAPQYLAAYQREQRARSRAAARERRAAA